MQRLLPPALGIVLIVAAGILNGQKTDRWGIAEKVEAAADRLKRVPPAFGDWYSTDLEISQYQIQQAEAVGYLSRRYVNRTTGDSVSVMILCGRHGPISVHPPTVCFTGAGWNLDASEKRRELTFSTDKPAHAFWQADFLKTEDGIAERQRTYWAWSTDGNWRAPDNPRFAFAGSPYLYKMYVTYFLPDRSAQVGLSDDEENDETSTSHDPAYRFMHEFLPLLRQTLFSDNRQSHN